MFAEVTRTGVMFTNRHAFHGSLPTVGAYLKLAIENSQATVETATFDGELIMTPNARFYDSENGFLNNRTNRDGMMHVVYDVIDFNGQDLRTLSYSERWKLLNQILVPSPNSRVQLADNETLQTAQQIQDAFTAKVQQGLEGVIVKPETSTYSNYAWAKLKFEQTEDVVILGIRKTKSFPIAESFLVGYYDPTYTDPVTGRPYRAYSHAASGLSVELKHKLGALLLKHQIGFDKENIYVEPFVVIEVRHNGRLKDWGYRHPSIMRVREDKNATQCTLTGVAI
jgi:ATP-dependent DNA ligase